MPNPKILFLVLFSLLLPATPVFGFPGAPPEIAASGVIRGNSLIITGSVSDEKPESVSITIEGFGPIAAPVVSIKPDGTFEFELEVSPFVGEIVLVATDDEGLTDTTSVFVN